MSKIALHGTKIEALRFLMCGVPVRTWPDYFYLRVNDAVHFAIILGAVHKLRNTLRGGG